MKAIAEVPTVEIRPTRGWIHLRLGELLHYRELIYFLTWRDLKIRYKQTVLGATWAIVQPVLLMVVFSVFLGRLGKVPSEGLPYPVFTFAALVPWTLVSQSVTGASDSLVRSANLVSKVYFPRLALPLGTVGSYVVDYLIAMVILFLIMWHYGVGVTLRVFWLVPLTALAIATALALGIYLAALNVKYRDVRLAVPFLVQLWLFLSPIAYPASVVPARWRSLYSLNPVAGVVEGFRWALLKTPHFPGSMLAISTSACLVALGISLSYFRRVERTFADVI